MAAAAPGGSSGPRWVFPYWWRGPRRGGAVHYDSAGVVLVVGVVLAAEIAQAVGSFMPALGGLDVELLGGVGS